jgi:predicted DNA binding protein
MATVMEFRLPPAAFPLGSIFDGFPDASVELERLIPHEPLLIPYFWVRGVVVADIEAAFDTHPGLVGISQVDAVDDEYLMKVTWDREYAGILDALAESNIVVLAGRGTKDGWEFEVRSESREAMGDLQSFCAENDIPIEITAVHALVPVREEGFGVTEAQRQALVLAYDRGYFDTPRETTLANIAAELDITQQSLSSRLKRGHRRLIEATLVDDRAETDRREGN